MLTIEKALDQQQLTLKLNGRLDMLTAPDLEKEIRDLPNDITKLVFDCEKLKYISSAGIRLFLMSNKRMGGKDGVDVINVCDNVMEILEAVGLVSIMNIEKEADK